MRHHGRERAHLSRVVVVSLLFSLIRAPAAAAQSDGPWSVSESVQGSFNSAGQIYRIDTSVAYRLTGYLEIGGGVPVYVVKAADAGDPLGSGWNAGPGNAYLDFRLSTSRAGWYFSSGVTAAAPTGDRDRGFSTGHVSADWDNSVAVYLPSLTLFGSAGLANTVSDTSFFIRPFTTTGLVGHFDGGLFLPVNSWLGLGALGYGVRGGGEQQLISRIVRTDHPTVRDRRRGFEDRADTRGQDLADDHGFSAWVDILGGDTSFQVGYSRSVAYAYDTAFFSVGFDILH